MVRVRIRVKVRAMVRVRIRVGLGQLRARVGLGLGIGLEWRGGHVFHVLARTVARDELAHALAHRPDERVER